MMSYRLSICVLVLVGLLKTCVGEDPQKVVGQVKCTYDERSDLMEMRFIAKLNGDPIAHTFAYVQNEVTNEYEHARCTHTLINGEDENGDPATYLQVETVINLNNPNRAAATNPCGFQSVTRPNPDDGSPDAGFRILLALREYEHFTGKYAGNYRYTCYMSNAIQTFLVSDVEVLGPEELQPGLLGLDIDFDVLRRPKGEVLFIPDDFCVVGEQMKLRITLRTDGVEYLEPWGLALSSTRVARSLSTLKTSTANMLLGVSGCQVSGNILDLSSEWQRLQSSTRTTAVYETGLFTCKRYLNSDELWFGTYFDLCMGEYEADESCINFCDSNTARRKRQVNNDTGSEQREINTYITIINEDEGVNMKQESSLSMPMIVTISVACVAIVVAMVVFVAFLCIRRRNHEKDSDVDSRASSDRKLPVF